MAGNAESIPAISIASPSRLVNLNPKNLVDADHQANTGVENPIIQAGITIIKTNNININKLFMNIVEIINEIAAIITPPKNSAHKWLDFGISRGVESFTI